MTNYIRENIKIYIVVVITLLFLALVANASFASGKCPQARKTKLAPANIFALDNTDSADVRRGKLIYEKKAKPIACKMCHGINGDGTGKLGKALKPSPRNFTCSEIISKEP